MVATKLAKDAKVPQGLKIYHWSLLQKSYEGSKSR